VFSEPDCASEKRGVLLDEFRFSIEPGRSLAFQFIENQGAKFNLGLQGQGEPGAVIMVSWIAFFIYGTVHGHRWHRRYRTIALG